MKVFINLDCGLFKVPNKARPKVFKTTGIVRRLPCAISTLQTRQSNKVSLPYLFQISHKSL